MLCFAITHDPREKRLCLKRGSRSGPRGSSAWNSSQSRWQYSEKLSLNYNVFLTGGMAPGRVPPRLLRTGFFRSSPLPVKKSDKIDGKALRRNPSPKLTREFRYELDMSRRECCKNIFFDRRNDFYRFPMLATPDSGHVLAQEKLSFHFNMLSGLKHSALSMLLRATLLSGPKLSTETRRN